MRRCHVQVKRYDGGLLRQAECELHLHRLPAVSAVVPPPQVVRVLKVLFVNGLLKFLRNLLRGEVQVLERSRAPFSIRAMRRRRDVRPGELTGKARFDTQEQVNSCLLVVVCAE